MSASDLVMFALGLALIVGGGVALGWNIARRVPDTCSGAREPCGLGRFLQRFGPFRSELEEAGAAHGGGPQAVGGGASWARLARLGLR